MKPADLYTLIRDAALAFSQDKAPRLAAAIAYYAMFSIAPLLLVAVAIAGRFLSNTTVLSELFGKESLIYQSLGGDAAAFLQSLIPEPDSLLKSSAAATGVGLLVLFMGATGLFVQLQDALNSLWSTQPPQQNILKTVKTRLISFLMIIGIGVVLMVFLAANTFLSAKAHQMVDNLGFGASLIRLGTFVLSALFLTPVFAGIYKVLPDVKLEWREVWIGGAVTATLFTLGQVLIGVYFGRAAPASVFGAAASLVLLMLWIYYSSMIFFFGAEVTWVYSQLLGTHAGGAANLAKKQAITAHGGHLDPLTHPAGHPPPPETRPPSHPVSEPRLLPTLPATLWNALSALLAVPSVIILRLLGMTGQPRRKK